MSRLSPGQDKLLLIFERNLGVSQCMFPHQSGFDPVTVPNEHTNIPLAFLASNVQHKLCWQFRYAADHAAICFPQK